MSLLELEQTTLGLLRVTRCSLGLSVTCSVWWTVGCAHFSLFISSCFVSPSFLPYLLGFGFAGLGALPIF
jgi:hypothetical protein